MESSREIQDRLENLGLIDHVVRSMRAMSAIRWRRASHALQAVQRYAAQVQTQLSLAVSFPTPLVRDPSRWRKGRLDRVGLIVISSDHGLCGPFNTVLFNTADVHIRRWREEKGERGRERSPSAAPGLQGREPGTLPQPEGASWLRGASIVLLEVTSAIRVLGTHSGDVTLFVTIRRRTTDSVRTSASEPLGQRGCQ